MRTNFKIKNSETKNTNSTDGQISHGRPRIRKLVKILKDRHRDPDDRFGLVLMAQVARIETCGLEYGSSLIGSKRWLPRCKQKLCPWCQSTEAKASSQVFDDQFDEYADSKC